MSSWLTLTVASRATRASISAHDTTPGHAHSSSILILSICSNPLKELLFSNADFSVRTFGSVESRRTDPSHPCTCTRLIYEQYIFSIPFSSTLLSTDTVHQRRCSDLVSLSWSYCCTSKNSHKKQVSRTWSNMPFRQWGNSSYSNEAIVEMQAHEICC